MNPESSSTLPSRPLSSQRKERGSIAAQACETQVGGSDESILQGHNPGTSITFSDLDPEKNTNLPKCRSRKQKCDEKRPKCTLCQRMKLECRYREPLPTKKDKTLVEILDRLTSLEGKVDQLGDTGSQSTRRKSTGYGPPQSLPVSQSLSSDIDDTTYSTQLSYKLSRSGTATSSSQPYRHSSAAHRVLTWTAIQQLLLQSVSLSITDIKILERDGSAFVVQVHRDMPNLPLDDTLAEIPFLGMQSQVTRNTGVSRVIFPALTRAKMQDLAKSYFDTFNFMYPFMDRDSFFSDTLTRVHSEGFDGDTASVISLLIFALGELATESAEGSPVETYNGRPSGIRGGTRNNPPGLAYFNEARKRIGFVNTQCDLETVQIFSLAGLYYESCSRHLDFWRMSEAAASACKVLVTCNAGDWNSQRGDLVKRVFWHCAIMEMGLYLELDLPPTGLINIEEDVPLPTFEHYSEADHRGDQSSHFQAHFASQVALRRLCADIHFKLNEQTSSMDMPGPTSSVLKGLVSKLGEWRALLPPTLQWQEHEPQHFPQPQQMSMQTFPVDPVLAHSSSQPSMPLFSTNLSADYVRYPFAYDIQVALLRTRYYYAKFIIYRPYVYKALHFPEEMDQVDAEGAAECLRCCLKWPLALSPPSRRKRMIPYLFCWSQNFLSILIIMHLSQHNEMLRGIRTQLCGDRFAAEIGTTIETLIDWIRDLKNVDPIALWSWNIVKGIYHLEP